MMTREQEIKSVEDTIRRRLFELQDGIYREFQCRLMPTVPRKNVIGIRTPMLREYARELSGTEDAAMFLTILPHKYYEENNLHGFLVERIKDFDVCLAEVDRFLPYVDNWATCDLIMPKVFKKRPPELLCSIRRWIASGETYTVRFGIGMLMSYYLGDAFKPEYLELVAEVRSDEYYVNMMAAWFFATALAKQYDETLPYIVEKKLPRWTHNKTIRKAIESYRITDEHKELLRTLRIK